MFIFMAGVSLVILVSGILIGKSNDDGEDYMGIVSLLTVWVLIMFLTHLETWYENHELKHPIIEEALSDN